MKAVLMAVDTPAKLAVLGAGPIGLEAALYGRFLGYEVVVFERGQVCEQVLSWGHIRMITPAAMNRSVLGVAAIQAQDESYRPAADDTFLTAAEWVKDYLRPLAETDLIADHLRLGTEVLAVGKEELRKHELPGHEDRGDWSFRILVREPDGRQRIELADVVIDATGVLGQPNWIGHGGMPAVGELELQAQIEHGFPDFLGKDRPTYAGRNILLSGDDWMTALNASGLAALALEVPQTRITWITDGEPAGEAGPVRFKKNDPVPERVRITTEANTWAVAGTDSVRLWPATKVEAIRPRDRSDGFEVEFSGKHTGAYSFDAIAASVGFRPNREIYRELQAVDCFASEQSPPPEVDPTGGTRRPLLQPEPNFYLMGAKRWGRDSSFLMFDGLNEIRELFKLIGDRESLDLYWSAKSLLR
jgi:hypothetical protein